MVFLEFKSTTRNKHASSRISSWFFCFCFWWQRPATAELFCNATFQEPNLHIKIYKSPQPKFKLVTRHVSRHFYHLPSIFCPWFSHINLKGRDINLCPFSACKLPEFKLAQSRMARDLTILSEPRSDISRFYDGGKPGLHKYFIQCFLPASKSKQARRRRRRSWEQKTIRKGYKHIFWHAKKKGEKRKQLRREQKQRNNILNVSF